MSRKIKNRKENHEQSVGVQWELRAVLALRNQRFASSLPLDARTSAHSSTRPVCPGEVQEARNTLLIRWRRRSLVLYGRNRERRATREKPPLAL
jgi:hypothetical protein